MKPSLSLFAAASLLLSACTVGPDYRRPAIGLPAAFKESQSWQPAAPQDHLSRGNWWDAFGDPQLNRLEHQVLPGNQSIAQAEAQFRQSQALVQSAAAAYFPVATASTSANRFRAASGQNIAVSGVRNLFNAALSAAWEPDLWGRVRRQVEASEAAAQASAATLQNLRLSIQATLAQNYFQLRTLDAQLRLLNDTIVSYERALTITQNRYAAGVSAKTDVVQAQLQLESTRAQAVDLGVQRTQMEHAIAVLIGKTPAELTILAGELYNPPTIPVTVPSALLQRRPDIAAAERQAAAANAQIGVAKAAYFPTLNLSAQNGAQSSTFEKLFMAGARYWALGPAAFALPLFDGGARGAQLQQAIDAYDASVAGYRQIVLAGFQEVEDNMAALRILKQETAMQKAAVDAAKKSLELVTNQYKAGLVSYLDVVTIQTRALDSQTAAVQLQGRQLITSVLLVKALGGGWDAGLLPARNEVGGRPKWSQFLPVPLK